MLAAGGAYRYSQRVHLQAALLSPDILDEVPVLPLFNVVLFPHVVLPLQLAEPSVWQMMHDVGAGSRYLVVASVCPGAPGGLSPVGCLAQLLQLEGADRAPGGQALVRGERRVQLLQEQVGSKAYRQFRVQPLSAKSPGEPAASRSAAALHQFVRALGLAAAKRDLPLAQVLRASKEPAEVADFLAASLLQGVSRQQAILACARLEPQIEAMTEGLAEALLKLLGPDLSATARD